MEYESLEVKINDVFGEGTKAFCDFIIYDKDDRNDRFQLIIGSFYKRGVNTLRNFTANARLQGMKLEAGLENKNFIPNQAVDSYFTIIDGEYEKIEHCFVLSKQINERYIFCTDDSAEDVFYNYLMHNYDLPLMRTWSRALLEHCQLEQMLTRVHYIEWCTDGTQELPINGHNVPFRELIVFRSDISPEWLDNAVYQLFLSGEIKITEKKQKKLELENANMDTYFQKYGYTIVNNLTKEMHPLTAKKPKVEEVALKSKKLFPQQAVNVNGVVNLLHHSKYAILNEGMGCGKSLQAAATVEAYHVKKYLSSHPGKTLKDVYTDPTCINYRVIIMAPGHLLEKWAGECLSQIPYCRVEILRDFSQIINIWKQGKNRHGKEIFIASKDFLKLSSQYRPLPTKIREKEIPVALSCSKCGANEPMNALAKHKKCACGNNCWDIKRQDTMSRGLICPECGEIIFSGRGAHATALVPTDFAAKNDLNHKCSFCGTTLWTLHVHNLNSKKEKINKWYKISHYANKTHKTRTTSWVLRGHEAELYQSKNIEDAYAAESTEVKMRKFSPCVFIKQHMKGFFDFAIFDELHLYKGGGTAQGNAMHCLVKASKKILGLTGTIAGGVAEDLFYLLFRLDPGRMIERGFRFNGVSEFTKRYGTTETVFESVEGSTHNGSSRGKKLRQPKTKPGISPLIFGDFLIDKAVFLDIVDMGTYIPELKEEIIPVKMDEDVRCEYERVIDIFRQETKGCGLNPLSSAMLNFSLSYLDKPFGCGSILHPKTGSIVAEPADFLPDKDELLPKEDKLVSLVRNELKENRRVFVYAEYTGKGNTCVTGRIKAVLEKHCNLKGKVAILESSSPISSKREEWIHKMAAKGIEVFITNPKNVETGLDFVFDHAGVEYNYPTLIFYQMGYNLFTLWQSSRRHFRLSQKKECRTFYLAYEGTVQMTVLEIMGSKQIATSAIQGGNFSSEGLSAMATGVDARLKMIQALQENTSANTNHIKGMFAANRHKNNNEFSDFNISEVFLFSDLLDDEESGNASCLTDDLIVFFANAVKSVKSEERHNIDVIVDTDTINKTPLVLTEAAKTSRGTVKGQLSLF